MEDKNILYFGALLHDIGKIVYRGSSAAGTHSKLGADFVSEVFSRNDGVDDRTSHRVVEQVRYHHAREMRGASDLSNDSLAYLTYFADNISAGMDRKVEGDESEGAVFDRDAKLRKIFNILKGHHDDNVIEHGDYNALRHRIEENLLAIDISYSCLNSLLNLLEATTSAVPSSTNMNELVDVSLFDHSRTTAGIAACIYDYCLEREIHDYRKSFFDREQAALHWQEPMFLLYSCDLSGVQDFIYGISGSKALKQLRARSFYLELLMEHVIDELLSRLGLCRANLLYSGGGHAYLLLPNTASTLSCLREFVEEVGLWFIDRHTTDLYLAHAWAACSAADLANDGDDKQRYPDLYRKLSEQLSAVKASRYSVESIRKLNFGSEDRHIGDRECTECRRSDVHINDERQCSLCASLSEISKMLVECDVFAIAPSNESESIIGRPHLELPLGCVAVAMNREEYLSKQPRVRRIYTKNSWDMGIGLATHIWMGDYTSDADDDQRFDTYSKLGSTLEPGKGIRRLGVLRADVDDLGATFAYGIPSDKVSISRSATLSRALSYFFKHKINEILADKSYRLQVIYSGGDDLCIVGNWSDVLFAALDIRRELGAFTGNGSITLSAGVGMFDSSYPIARMASETGLLEDAAKGYHFNNAPDATKNAIALWDDRAVFDWREFEKVVERKNELEFLFARNEKGKAFIYKIISLLRSYDEVASAPRLAYLLARSFEGDDKSDNDRACTDAARKLYGWASDVGERKMLTSALEWYVYESRERD